MKRIILEVILTAAAFCGAWVIAKNTPSVTLGTLPVNGRAEATVQNALDEHSFSGIKLGMSHKDAMKTVKTNFTSKNETMVYGINCTVYEFASKKKSMGIMESEDGKVIGKYQYGIVSPKVTVTDDKIQGLSSNASMSDVKKAIGEGTIAEEVRVADSSTTVLLYKSKTNTWSLAFSNDELVGVSTVTDGNTF